jgi:hypothetical protein
MMPARPVRTTMADAVGATEYEGPGAADAVRDVAWSRVLVRR